MEDKLLNKCKYLLIGLIAVSLILLIISVFKGESSTDMQLGLTYGLAGIMVAAMIFSPIYGVIIDPKSIKGILIAFGIFGVVALISWIMSSASLPQEMLDNVGINASIEKVCDFEIKFLYIMVFGTIAAIIYSAVSKLFK